MIGVSVDRDGDLAEIAGVADDYLAATVVPGEDDGADRWTREEWTRACADLGMAALGEPEEDGGVGASLAMIGETLRVGGRRLNPLPVQSSAVLGQSALRLLADPDERVALLEDILGGATVLTVAPFDGPSARSVEITEQDIEKDTDLTVSGELIDVLDGDTADLLLHLVPVGADQVRLLAIDLNHTDAVRRSACATIDLSRSFATVRLTAAPARWLGPAVGVEHRDQLAHRWRWALACDQLGMAEVSLETTLAHLGQRVQFGRVIGSFQAVKHQCADLAIALDEARSAVAHLTWALETGSDEVELAAPMAAVVCGEAARLCTEAAVHLHGGIGFTWEHPAHRYVRRATTDRALFRTARAEREAVLTAHGL